jgi:hypothetical protein
MAITHLENHEHAFLNASNIVENIAAFSQDAHASELLDTIKTDHKNSKVVCCCTFGKPYIGDTWDETNKVWIQTAPRIIPIEPIEPTE